MGLSDREITVIIGFEAATKQSQADEQERQQRIAQSRQNINVGR